MFSRSTQPSSYELNVGSADARRIPVRMNSRLPKPITGSTTGLAIVEAAASLYSKTLSSAEIEAPPCVSRDLLAYIGRELIRIGETAHLIEVDNTGQICLIRAQSWDVLGNDNPESWRYRLTLRGPTSSRTVLVPASRVIHQRWAEDHEAPWRGLSPLQLAELDAATAWHTTVAAGVTASGPAGNIINMQLPPKANLSPADAVDLAENYNQKFEGMDGQSHFMITNEAPVAEVAELHGILDQGLVSYAESRELKLLAAMGLPASLMTAANSAAQREAYRHFIHASLKPLSQLLAAELEAKLEQPVRFTFPQLAEAELTNKGRAFSQLVRGGMSVNHAAQICGIAPDPTATSKPAETALNGRLQNNEMQ